VHRSFTESAQLKHSSSDHIKSRHTSGHHIGMMAPDTKPKRQMKILSMGMARTGTASSEPVVFGPTRRRTNRLPP